MKEDSLPGAGQIFVRRVEGHEDRVETVAADGVLQREGIQVPGDADEARDLLVARLEEGLQRTIRSEDFFDVFLIAHVVHLPAIEPVGLQALERGL